MENTKKHIAFPCDFKFGIGIAFKFRNLVQTDDDVVVVGPDYILCSM